MDEQKRKLTEEEIRITEEIDALLDEVQEDSDVVNTPLPERLERNIRKSIHARELEKIERAIDEELAKGEALLAAEAEAGQKMESEEVKELIRLGKIYKKRRKLHRYLVAAAVLVFVLALGVTSIGGPEKVFETFKFFASGRDMTQTNSGDDVDVIDNITEEEVYQQIEEKFNFTPVRMLVLSDDVGFLKASMGEEIQGAHILYGAGENVKLSYFIRPNYRKSSYGTDMDEQLIDEYNLSTETLLITVKQYSVEEENNNRWSGEFTYKDVNYYIVAMDMEKEEFENILKNLFFS